MVKVNLHTVNTQYLSTAEMKKGGTKGVAIVLDREHAVAMNRFNTGSDRFTSLRL